MRVLFAGGGTGGHVMPGAATAEALSDLLPGTRSVFLTTDRRAERLCRGSLQDFEVVVIPGLRSGGTVDVTRLPLRMARAAGRLAGVFGRLRPHVVVGLGELGCAMPVVCARTMGIRTMLFEAQAVPGRTVRMLSPMVDCVALAFEQAARMVRARSKLMLGTLIARPKTAALPCRCRNRM